MEDYEERCADIIDVKTLDELTRAAMHKLFPEHHENLLSWQKYFIAHLYCHGRIELIKTRRGPAWICTCRQMPCQDKYVNVCVAEGCYGEACIKDD